MSRDPSFGKLLAAHRAEARLTQEELAARSGLSVHAVSLLERGARASPRETTVASLARGLGLRPAEKAALAAAARRRPVGRTSALVVAHDLLVPPTTFVGREQQLTRARALLARPEVRLLTLTGSPGAGKTRLALELAAALVDEYRNGALAVTLGPLGEPGLVMPAIRQALGLPEAADQPALETVAAHCRARHLLLVLDNFEHLLAAGPELVDLLARCPGLQALVTSRAPLRVRAEHELPVPPLQLPPAGQELAGRPAALAEVAAVRLFLERADAVLPGFRLTVESAEPVAEICRRLDGLPLALELAAPWLKLLTPPQLLARLDHRLELLVYGARDLPERQRTMRAALRWSSELLDEEPRTLLRRLSVFAGSAPLDAMERVCRAAGDLPGGVLPHLAVLLEHSLVQQRVEGEPRIAMLESVREYGRELLVEAGELEATASAHLDHYAELAALAGGEIVGQGQASWLERLRREHDNVRAALSWAVGRGLAEAGLRLAGALRLYWYHGGYRSEGLSWLERLLAIEDPVPPAVRAEALRTAGALAAQLGSYELAIARHGESLAIYRALGDEARVADVLWGMAEALSRRGDQAEAIRLLEGAVAVLRRLDDRAALGTVLMNLGVYVSREDPRRATELYEEALAIRRSLEDALGTASCLINLGLRAMRAGDLELAQIRLDEGAAIARRLDAPYSLAAALAGLGDLERARGDAAAAAACYRESLALFVGIGESRGTAVCLRCLAWLAWAEGQSIAAARLYGAADALCPGAAAVDSESAMHEAACAALRAQLGGDRFEVAHEAGRHLSAEAAAAEASSPASKRGRRR